MPAARRCLPALGLLLAVLLALPTGAAPPAARQGERPRIGLVLSGGGARGIAHIGVLKVLEELRIPIDAIAATSMGAIVGGIYASGMSVADMEREVSRIDWLKLFDDTPPRQDLSIRRKQEQNRYVGLSVGLSDDGQIRLPKGAIGGLKLELLLKRLVAGSNGIEQFDSLPIPYRAIATDLETGQMVVFDRGPLATAMRASMSVPGAIAPSEVGGHILVDGGLVRNLPVDIARRMGVDLIIAVNLGTPLLERDKLNDILGVTVQMIAILTEQNVQQSLASLGPDDILIQPELGDISAADFQRGKEAIAIGEAAARRVVGPLSRHSLSPEAYQSWRTQRRPPPYQPAVVDEVRITGLKRVSPGIVERELAGNVGKPLDVDEFSRDLNRLYGRGDFERFNYRLQRDGERNVLAVEAVEKSWGPNYLLFGLGASSDFQNDTEIIARFGYNRTWINEAGAEWRTELDLGTRFFFGSEFYQPFAADSPFFVAPYLSYESRAVPLFEGTTQLAEYDAREAQLGADLGYTLGSYGELRLGLAYRGIEAEPSIGDPALPDYDASEGVLSARLLLDTLDNYYFPRQGAAVGLELSAHLEALGAAEDYTKLEASWQGAYTVGADTLLAGVRLGLSPDGELPIYDQFTLGGFANLSGLRSNQLRGSQLGFGRLIYYHKLDFSAPPISRDFFVGGTLELGGVWDDLEEIDPIELRGAGSVFVGADTLVGPIYLGYGYTEGGENSVYLFIGRP
ncbi:MAG TPA: patatin-like phospholipase family protein [Candidatus Competibacteraceae bacterium]|nr:patatin-like phospholipase family protein [Candidatus Competibacteraceae bacterium]